MKDSIRIKLENLSDRLQELDALLADSDIIADQNQFRSLSKEYAEIQPVVACFQEYHQNLKAIAATKEMLHDEDASIRVAVVPASSGFAGTSCCALRSSIRQCHAAIWCA